MGGKKKTKWKKLPLEEFTKDIPSKKEKVPAVNTCQTNLTSEEASCIPTCSETPDIVQNYVEPYECIDGLWYPTSCTVYNPALYSNYLSPLDPCCYYYTVPEATQTQEYTPVYYQEYAPALPKDTVYLLLPPQTVRPPQIVQNVVPEWQSRRRRRRYEGYADYAVIPDKSSSSKRDEKENNKASRQHVNCRRNSVQSNSCKKMTSFIGTSNFSESISEKAQHDNQQNYSRYSPISSVNVNIQNDSVEVNVDNCHKSKKKAEICNIHYKNKLADQKPVANEKENCHYDADTNIGSTDKVNQKKVSTEASVTSVSSNCIFYDDILSDTHMSLESVNKSKQKSKPDRTNNVLSDTISDQVATMSNFNEETDSNSNSLKSKDCMVKKCTANIEVPDVNENLCVNEQRSSEKCSISVLPDIVNTLNKSTSGEIRDSEFSIVNALSDDADLDKERSLKSKSLLSKKTYSSSLLNSEALHNEMENELKHLNNLHSLQTNQSIYKLAYDENVTDQSEADSRSPSPVDPESIVPSSITSAEILVHEADSGSEAGSEDLELLPHRYESETFLNQSKHVYVNKLSLAVELLRTQESLPYDKEFKRVVGENETIPGVHGSGKLNLGFTDDTYSPNSFNITNNLGKQCTSSNTYVNDVVSKSPIKDSMNNSIDNAIFRDIEFDDNEDEICLQAQDAATEDNSNQNSTGDIRAGYRRFGVQAQHYFSQRTMLPLNPCFCCIIM